MDNKTIYFPNYTIGENILAEISDVIDKYGKNILFVGGKTGLEKTKNKIEESISNSNLNIIDFLWYGGECTYKNIQNVCEIAKKNNADLIVGIGGGKALDTAKGAAERLRLPIFTVPTIASTCAAVTPLSIIYTENGDYEDLFQLEKPPVHIFMDSDVIAKAPTKYLWAGIGDTLAKYYEVDILTKEKKLVHCAAMAKQLSSMCVNPLIEYGEKALKDSENEKSSFELEEIILNNIISTGIVAMLVGEENNGAAAHALFYGFTLLEEIEKHHLHGEVVGYGILVMLMMDGQADELKRLYRFYKKIKLPTSLSEMNIKNDRNRLEPVLEKAVEAPDMKKMPYTVTKEMLMKAIDKLEVYIDK